MLTSNLGLLLGFLVGQVQWWWILSIFAHLGNASFLLNFKGWFADILFLGVFFLQDLEYIIPLSSYQWDLGWEVCSYSNRHSLICNLTFFSVFRILFLSLTFDNLIITWLGECFFNLVRVRASYIWMSISPSRLGKFSTITSFSAFLKPFPSFLLQLSLQYFFT